MIMMMMKSSSLYRTYWNSGKGVGPQGCCWIYDGICRKEKFCLQAESCDLVASLTLCKQKHPVKPSAIYQLRTAVLWCGKGSGREASPNWVRGDNS